MTGSTPEYRTVLTSAALRSVQAVPPRIAEPLLAFVFGSLAEEPRRRGKPLQGELAGRWSARRGDYRIVYRLDDDTKTMYVLKIARRVDVYRPG
ncbi:type II toxin-antitoxin system RelE family toxin [Jatrophihabitans sp.]|uniref:type II toxin-antitoxin system RelE family toxin n=1 Tax=Jatrophihabitans sp. TaxID=1932789 RepID=UPI002F03EC10